ncbi:hypothetical protein RS030_172624 [Cryptosporidium xiaoi]|uniref:Reactive oxygen species modulator 1 n=1 Tax=Cryptosporidium xiaoi TaxID=659607 RepID=A0AAV9XZK5_9CRYT
MLLSFVETHTAKKDKLASQNRSIFSSLKIVNVIHKIKHEMKSKNIMNFSPPSKTENKLKEERKGDKILFPIEVKFRIRECIDNIKLGVKTGVLIGSVFGGVNGTYHAIKYKSYISIPISMIGGAISFGFFLGCGMLVRCQGLNESKCYSHKKYI